MTTPLRCIIDASVGIKLYIRESISPKVEQLFAFLDNPNTDFFVPDLFYIECASIIWKYARASLYNLAEAPVDIASLKGLRLQVTSTAELMEDAVTIGLAHGISAYDASYVALSERVGAPLLTLDQKLVNALAATSYDVRSFIDFSIPPLL